jgi:hypothetical protein
MKKSENFYKQTAIKKKTGKLDFNIFNAFSVAFLPFPLEFSSLRLQLHDLRVFLLKPHSCCYLSPSQWHTIFSFFFTFEVDTLPIYAFTAVGKCVEMF